jgi:hypothetical protein
VILQYNSVLANPSMTGLQTTKNFNVDLLFTYQVNAWTALFVGYNTNQQNIELLNTPAGPVLTRSSGLMNDGRQFFAKFSYLFRF